jgi:hypothetical protein
MSAAIVLALAIYGSDFEAAATGRQGAVVAARFDNSESGVSQLTKWIGELEDSSESPAIQTCVAVLRWAPKASYSSPAMKFARGGAVNTLIWNPRQIEALFPMRSGAISIAEGMVAECAKEHSRTAKP